MNSGGGIRPWIAWGFLLPWLVFAIVRTFGLESGGYMAQVLAFAPYVAVTALIPLATAAALRVWTAVAVATLAAVVLLLAVVPRGFGGETEPAGDPGPSLRVLAANMKLGDGEAQPLVDLVEEIGVDVLSVEELTPGLARQLERAGLHDLLPHQVLRPADGSDGTGLYTRMPTGPATVTHLPGGFPLISAPLEIADAPPTEIFSVHTNPPTADNWEEDLEALPGAETSPLRIMIGDFNATLDHAAFRDVVDMGYTDAAESLGDGFAFTWQVGPGFPPPLFAIDHVLVDERIGVHEFSAHELPGTDHKAVYAELVLPAG